MSGLPELQNLFEQVGSRETAASLILAHEIGRIGTALERLVNLIEKHNPSDNHQSEGTNNGEGQTKTEAETERSSA